VRRSHVLLAGAVVVAGATAFWGGSSGGRDTPPADIGGDPIATSSPAPASETAAFANLAEQTKTPVAAPLPKPPPVAAIDLDKITRDGDRFVAPMPDGKQAVLTLDPNLQALAEKLLDESRAPRGAIVVMAPDGRILALAGRRTTEPKGALVGTFDWHLATDAWAPAASVFKLVTAAALVGNGFPTDEKVCFHGGLRSVLEHNLHDDKRDSRCETLGYGIAHSQNALIGKAAFQKLESKQLAATARSLGWSTTFPELQSNVGELALPATHDLAFAQAAAGFSDTRLSVLGGALLADDGEQPAPRLIDSIDGAPAPAGKPHRALDPKIARSIAEMMVQTCDKGSAAKSFGRGGTLRVAGKTGTLTKEEPFYMEHSWFVGFAPADKPQVIVSVLFGNPENWHLRGHEAARRLIDRALRPANGRDKRS
jgi:penicillin-binding protein A